jgi:hypothetical protein
MTRVDLENWIKANCPPNPSGDTPTGAASIPSQSGDEGQAEAASSDQPVRGDAANDSQNLSGDADQVNITAESLDAKIGSDVAHEVVVEKSPPAAPVAEQDGSSNNEAFSPEDQRALDALMLAWVALMDAWNTAPEAAQTLFEQKVRFRLSVATAGLPCET